jgi:hypothetical protein
MFSADRFHPSSAGYAFLGTIYGRAVREAVESAALDSARRAATEPSTRAATTAAAPATP